LENDEQKSGCHPYLGLIMDGSRPSRANIFGGLGKIKRKPPPICRDFAWQLELT